jgi:hypothetical protein
MLQLVSFLIVWYRMGTVIISEFIDCVLQDGDLQLVSVLILWNRMGTVTISEFTDCVVQDGDFNN